MASRLVAGRAPGPERRDVPSDTRMPRAWARLMIGRSRSASTTSLADLCLRRLHVQRLHPEVGHTVDLGRSDRRLAAGELVAPVIDVNPRAEAPELVRVTRHQRGVGAQRRHRDQRRGGGRGRARRTNRRVGCRRHGDGDRRGRRRHRHRSCGGRRRGRGRHRHTGRGHSHRRAVVRLCNANQPQHHQRDRRNQQSRLHGRKETRFSRACGRGRPSIRPSRSRIRRACDGPA